MKTVLTDDDVDVVESSGTSTSEQISLAAGRIKARLARYFTRTGPLQRSAGNASIGDRPTDNPRLVLRENKSIRERGDALHGEAFGLFNRVSGPEFPSVPGRPLKVGFLSYPMLFQNEGGLQVQVRETQASLRKLGIDVRLIDTTRDDLADFDVVHIFSVIHGNVKLVEQARAKGCAVVVSGLLNPALVVGEPLRLAAVRILESLLARASRYKVTTDSAAVRKALGNAHHVIALSNWERRVASEVFGTKPERISVIPNGVSGHFFEADAAAFHAEYKIEGPFVFCPAQISPWKNQISLVKAMAGTGITVVLAGPVHEQNKASLDECMGVPNAKVVYLGNLDRMSPVFSGAYAAASAVVLPSNAESGPLVALEALAAGTPAIITRHNGLDMQADGRCLHTVPPFDVQAIRVTVLAVVAAEIDPKSCRAAVEDMSWSGVAHQIAGIYEKCLSHSIRSAA